jgi:hypothetical protein
MAGALTDEEKAVFDGVVSLMYESEEFEAKFNAFAREHCGTFDGEAEEQKLEYNDIYLKYRETFEGLIEEHLARYACMDTSRLCSTLTTSTPTQ